MLKYLRIHVFYKLLNPFQNATRRKRQKAFMDLLGIEEGMRVLDLGGAPGIWEFVDIPLDITILNLPGVLEEEDLDTSGSRHNFTFIEGDACDVQLDDKPFDLVFSNSVIEHVGNVEKQKAFASEVSRHAPRYWVQTPAKSFPIEAHTGMPFWWYYPRPLTDYLISNWRKKLPAWTEMVEGTTYIKKASFAEYFSDGTLRTEKFLGLPKSYIMFKS